MDLFPRIIETKAKINKWGLIKLETICTAKETINKMKRQSIKWEKIFANDVTDKGLLSKIYKEIIQLNIKKKKLIKNWTENLNIHFSKEYIQITNRYILLISLTNNITTREMPTKNTMRYHFISV